MKTITSLDGQYGINPQLVIRIAWSTGDLSYAMDEMESLDPEDLIYGYVKEFSDLSLIRHTEGFGEVNSIQVAMFDLFGHFKKKFEQEVIFSILATISIRTVADANEIELFEGIIEEPMWQQGTKEFSFSVVSEAIKGSLGYTPQISDISSEDSKYTFYQSFLNEETWPNVFGHVKKLKATRLNNISDGASTSYDQFIGVVDSFTGNIPVDGDYTEIYGEDEVEGYLYTKDFILIVTGTFNNNSASWEDEGTHIGFFNCSEMTYKLWEGSIELTTTQAGESIPTIGSLGESESGGLPVTLDEDPGLPLANLRLTIRLEFEYGAYTTYATCINQVGLEIAFAPNTVWWYIGELEEITLTAVHLVDQYPSVFTIPSGASFYIKGRTDYDIYVVDTKADTTIEKVQVEGEKDIFHELIEVADGVGDYYVENTAADGRFWTESDTADAHPHCTFIRMGGETFFNYHRNFAAETVIERESILVDCTAVQTTENEVFTYLAGLIGLTAVFHGTTHNKGVSWATTDEEDIPSILSEIAWQGIKGLRRSGTNLEVFDLQNTLPLVDPIRSDQIKLNSITIFPSDYSEIVTKLTLNYNLNDLLADIEESIHKHNVDLYDTIEAEVDVYIFNHILNVINTGIYWIGRYADPEYMIEVTGSLDLMKYEAWDTLTMALPTHHFAKESPLLNTHTVTDSKWDFSTLTVKEVSVNFKDMSVTLLLRTNHIVGSL